MRRWRLSLLNKLGSLISKSKQETSLTRRIEFESAQLKNTQERLASLRATSEKEEANVETLRASKQVIEQQLEQLQGDIDRQRRKLAEATWASDEATKTLEGHRDAARKSQKKLDKALKEIAGWNDEIEKSASDRHAIYRRCRLEEIDLPLVSGRLDRVPIEEVSLEAKILLTCRNNMTWRWTWMTTDLSTQ